MRHYTLCASIGAALLSGCGALPLSLWNGQDDARAPITALVITPQNRAVATHADRDGSWMLPAASGRTTLLYVSVGLHRVGVYNYITGKRVGTIGGLDDPYGGCVDAKGDVFITDYYDDIAAEYAHGGTKRLKTFTADGPAVGCSVDSKNDLAVTDRYTGNGNNGDVCVWKGGNAGKKPTCYSGLTACTWMWPAGYDDKGNLFIPGNFNTTGDVCVLLSGKSAMTQLPLNYTFNSPGAAMWDGKNMTLSDEGANGDEEGIVRVQLSRSMLRNVGKTLLGDNCYGSWEIELAPFILGTKNTPINHERGKVVVAENTVCANEGAQLWKYVAGGYPYNALAKAQGVVLAVSIGK